MQKSSLLIPGSNLLLAPAEKTWVPWSLNHQRNIQDFHQKDIRNHAPPTLDECYLYFVKFSSGVHFPTCYSLSHEPKKRLTNLDDTLCSFPRVLWNSVTLWPCRCHSSSDDSNRERHGPSLNVFVLFHVISLLWNHSLFSVIDMEWISEKVRNSPANGTKKKTPNHKPPGVPRLPYSSEHPREVHQSILMSSLPLLGDRLRVLKMKLEVTCLCYGAYQ